MTTPIASLSIAGRVTLNMHSLNNEGGEGNQIQTRMVDIISSDGDLHNVNAISGDMLKHILMQHYYQQAKERGMDLCESCQKFNTNRINADSVFMKDAPKKDAEFIDKVIQKCAMDDVGGFLVTEGRSTPRKSVCEFGWMLGMPDRVQTSSYFHVKFAPEKGEEKLKEDAEQQKTGANLGQSIFHRPASSGVYALICHLELSRIGLNDITRTYAISPEERQKRASLLIESLMHVFTALNGAMTSTQFPHLVALEGIITTSGNMTPAPLMSPLVERKETENTVTIPDYREQIESIAKSFNNKDKKETIICRSFETVSDFIVQMSTLSSEIAPFEVAQAR